jgi:hypothetical protein
MVERRFRRELIALESRLSRGYGDGQPSAFERAQYIRMLSGWSSWLAYGAYVRSHPDDVKLPS